MPVTAGFLGKFYIFNAALDRNLIWLAVLLALNSVIGAYYYLRVIVAMYMREPATGNSAAARAVDAFRRALDRRGWHDLRRIIPRPNYRLRPKAALNIR